MYRLIDGRSCGKTSRLLLLAKENHGTVVCSNPQAMREKAYAYGLSGIEFISYNDFLVDCIEDDTPRWNPNSFVPEEDTTIYYIDEMEAFVKYLMASRHLGGYTLSNED